MKVFPVGTKVFLRDDIPATIKSILIKSEDCVGYECSWFNGRERKLEWFSDYEFSCDNINKSIIGFKKT